MTDRMTLRYQRNNFGFSSHNFQVKMHWLWQHIRAIKKLANICSVCARSKCIIEAAFVRHCVWLSSPRTLNLSNISWDSNTMRTRQSPNAKVGPSMACVRCNWPYGRNISKSLTFCVPCTNTISYINFDANNSRCDAKERNNCSANFFAFGLITTDRPHT